MRSKFDEQLELLHKELIQMGALCENAIAMAAKALAEGNTKIAGKVPEMSVEIDQKERDIETMCMKVLLQQQPVAKDLRMISSALKMVTDMERVGDQAADISEIVSYIAQEGYIKQLEHIPKMAEKAVHMVKRAVDAFINRDLDLARAVIDMDDEVDGLFDVIKRELIELIHQNSDMGAQALDLLMIAKYFERIGDHAVNIAEWVEFAITGVHKGEKMG